MPPLTALPFDIISQIFVRCLPEDPSPSPTEAPLLLARICRELRDVALATHHLWDTLDVEINPKTIASKVLLLEAWVPRAGNLPRSIGLTYHGGGRSQVHDVMLSRNEIPLLSTLLARYAPHWTVVNLHIPMLGLTRLHPPAEGFASLRKLVLDCGSFPEDKENEFCAFLDSPRLRELHIISRGSVKPISLPWAQLTILRLDNPTVVQSLEALVLVPNLVKFTCRVSPVIGRTPLAPPPLAHLESLALVLSERHVYPLLLRYLTVPGLLHLALNFHDPHQMMALELPALLARSRCSLRRLSVKLTPRLECNEAHYRELFHPLHSLEELEFIEMHAVALETALHLLKAHPELLPNLTTVHIEQVDGFVDPALLADLVDSRRDSPVQLKTVKFSSPSPPEYAP
ncbi:hypothetical protein B0H16DRAFT_874860 [Mycena metata]|uniref:F-box domain-containing protein n=1 Tax=Mycena metata TaxID=1033252 RepID=A0AAD7ISC5_9AGAR|nr:hypothetical protein B0H16DRAFT_874860 [Mycena metata]